MKTFRSLFKTPLLDITLAWAIGIGLSMVIGKITGDDSAVDKGINLLLLLLLTSLVFGVGMFVGQSISMTPGRVKYGPFRGMYRMGFVDLEDLRMKLTLAMALPETLVHRPTEEPREVARARALLAVLGLPAESDWVDQPEAPPADKPKPRLDKQVARKIREQLIILHGYDHGTASEIIEGYRHHGVLTDDEINGKELLVEPHVYWDRLMRRYLTKELVQAAVAHINVHRPPQLDETAPRADKIAAWTMRSYDLSTLHAQEQAIYYLADGDPLEAHHFRNLGPMTNKDRHDAVAAMYQNPGRRRAALADMFIELSELTTKS